MITGTTRLFAIIGDPVAHVRTPMAFNDYFAARGIDAICVPIHIGRDDLPRGWAGLKSTLNLDGFIVTAPHKAEAAQLCDKLEGDGVYTRVVNTVRREADGTFTGTLLDGRGFIAGMTAHGYPIKGRRFYMAGAGGAGTALAYALAGNGAAAITIHNRTRWKAENLVAGVGKAFPNCDVRLGNADASGHDVAVNATSLGLHPDDPHSFDLGSVGPSALVAEVVMKPEMTPLLIAAKARGHAIHFGTHMLNGQLELMMQFLGQSAPAKASASA
ncbi:MAG TPA: shikimate dehydrogenase [Pseudolabrys sp.]|jgi:shikimate dehydrogenase|nr:shikimate dehydrogenase [Pseudolabrys sp.]